MAQLAAQVSQALPQHLITDTSGGDDCARGGRRRGRVAPLRTLSAVMVAERVFVEKNFDDDILCIPLRNVTGKP